MAAVDITRSALREADLPPVCVVTGRPADGTVPFTAGWLPGWTFVLLLFGVVPFLVAAHFARVRVEGEVPVTSEALARRHRHHRRAAVLVPAGIAAALLAGFAQSGWLAWAAIGMLLGAVGSWVLASQAFIEGRPLPDGVHVRLRHVHPAFAEALAVQAASRSPLD
jgi:hypothetical protein